ncbi:biopolymer transporter ExbD [candidate division KSB1 bacterium]|nr:biopolymer transporter ExbD [candidate division KSB1 bacterium]NIR72728.1 biopolymer transporter ExbD [candidate division KSB1 bacterium]NIS26816.1 biopolymer transporter ExbD [candidate division KSB1 bacterium]NIT73610.1 biopolymer transporter ExbD [candidate division KSB1 bacterium]NIU27483.1 biopolymer transporter ExbD [candidate division KSB1 bacterium]
MAFIPSRIKKHNTGVRTARLNLTSMMDMFTIILVFLLKTYAAEGQLIQPSEYLTLPKSKIHTQPETALDIVVSKEVIMVNDKRIVNLSEVKKQEEFIIKPLREELLYHAKEAKNMEEEFGVPFSGKVTIQGDKSIHYKELVKVMATCGASEYPNMRLVVYRKEAS